VFRSGKKEANEKVTEEKMETGKNLQQEPLAKRILWYLVHNQEKATTRQTAEAIGKPFTSVTSVLSKLHKHLGDNILKREPLPDKRGFTYAITEGTNLGVDQLYDLYGSKAGFKRGEPPKPPFPTQIENVLWLLRDGKERDTSQMTKELGLEGHSLTILSRLYKRLPRTILTRRKSPDGRFYIYQLLDSSLSVPQLYKTYSLRALRLGKKVQKRVKRRVRKPTVQAGVTLDALKTKIEELINKSLGGPKVELEEIQVSLRLKGVGLEALARLLRLS